MTSRIRNISRHIFLVTSLLLFGVFFSYSQTGNAFLTNYYFPTDLGRFSVYDIKQLENGEMVLATSKGLILFDGAEWETVPLDVLPLRLERSEVFPGNTYVGTKEGSGVLTRSENGSFTYKALSESDESIEVWDILRVGDSVVFANSSEISFYVEKRINKGAIYNYQSQENNTILGLTANSGAVYYLDQTGFYLFGMEDPISTALAGSEIVFSCETNEGTFFGTDENQIWQLNKEDINEFELEALDYIRESSVSCGVETGDKMAIGTLTGGCVIVDSKTGKTTDIVNYQTGLPDDEVYAMTTDKNGGLWIAHEFGLTRVNLHFPITEYSTYLGLEGNLLSVLTRNEELYVATSEGVFYLDEVRDYQEIEVLVKKKIEQVVPVETNYISPILQTTERDIQVSTAETVSKREERKQKRKNRRKRRKKKEKEEDAGVAAQEVKVVEQDTISEVAEPEPALRPAKIERVEVTETSSQKIYALQSIKYIFKRIDGIEDKCKELLSVNEDIIVAGNRGLYAVAERKGVAILEGKYVNKLFRSRYDNRVYVGVQDGFLSVSKRGGRWKEEKSYSDFTAPVVSVVEVDNQNLWLGSQNMAYNIMFDGEQNITQIKPYAFDVESTEDVYVREIYGKPFFFLRSGIYGYDPDSDSIYYNIEVNERFFNRYRYVFSQNSLTWVLSNGEWININHEPELLSLKSFYLNLFDNVQNIYVDEEQNLWVIDGKYKLYFIKASAIPTSEQQFDVFFSKVRNTKGIDHTLSNLKFEYDNSALTFKLSAPYYVKSSGTQYQYIIEGLMNSWSEWTNNPNISFPFIPEGKYTLKVKARNVFGIESNEKSIEFVVLPPFWRTGWFYFLMLLAGIGAVVLVIKWRERNLKREQHILEEKVKVRTHQLNLEKKKSDELLHNILPHETAQELKSKGKATARYYNLTTVLFTDFKGFTKISESITPVELVKELDDCFIAFDEIIGQHNIEKIKTIGDAYMCAGGVPTRNQSNPIEAVLAGIAITDFMEELKQNRIAEDKPYWELRLGIHTGPLIAGVVGKKKFAYDVWGDTVNTASRMESSGEPGKINISSKTYELVKNYFVCTSRGKVAAKNKGELEMFFVERIKPEYSKDKEGRIPNEKLDQIVEELR